MNNNYHIDRNKFFYKNFNDLKLENILLNALNTLDHSSKRYELFNIVSDNGDSIYTTDIEELTSSRGRVFISEDKIKDLVDQLIEKMVGSSLNETD